MNKDLKKLVDATTKKVPRLIRDAREAGKLKRIVLDSPQLNYIFGGAFTIARTYHIFGPYSGGKTSLVNYLCGQLQRKLPSLTGRKDQDVVIFVDFERSFVTEYAEQNGLIIDDDKLIFMQPDDIETFVDNAIPMIQTGSIAAVVLDSEAAAPTRVQMIDPAGKANFGAGAKAMADSLRKLNIVCANNDTTYFVISQERDNMNPQARLPKVTGGQALPFYASWRGRVTKIDTIESKEETLGINMRVRNYKSKVGIPFRTAEIKLYYKGGFDSDEEYIDFLIKFGIVDLKGSYFTSEKYGFKSIQGRAKLQEWLNAHPTEYGEMKVQVNEFLAKKTELDANNAEPEDAEEIDRAIRDVADEIGLTESIDDEISEDEVKEGDD